MEAEVTDQAEAVATRRRLVATVYRRRPGLSVSELRLLIERMGVTASAADLVADARAMGLSVELGGDDVVHLSGAIREEAPAPVAAAPAHPSDSAGAKPIADPERIMAIMIGVLVLIALIGVVLGGTY